MLEASKVPERTRGYNLVAGDAKAKSRREAEDTLQNGIDVMELLLIFSRRKKTILQVTIAAAVIMALVMLLMSNTYTATASILPPEQKQSSLGALLGQIGSIAGLSDSDIGLTNPADLFIGMLHSRTIQDRLIDKFDLRKVYRVKSYQDARKKLDSRSVILAEKEGFISISVEDRDPSRAAAMANAYVEELHTLNSELAVSEAAQRRLFYEEKVNAERDALSLAEVQLRQVEEKTGLLQPEAQARVIIQSLADMRAQVAELEVQIESMRTYATKDNPELLRAEQQLAGLRAQVAKMQRSGGESGDGDLDLPTRKLPQAQLDYLRRARDLEYHEALFEFLNKQLEAARLDEAKDAILVHVVDKAVEPERKSGPPRLLTVLVTAFGIFAFMCLWALIAEALEGKQQDPRYRGRIAQLRDSLKFS
jgi:tyrosine-protein kinase Etk/Wzc